MTKVSSQQLTETCGDPIVIISHPRSGTHLTIDLLRKQFKECVSYKWPLEPQHYLYLSIEGFLEKNPRRRMREETALKIVRRPKRPIIKLHTYSWKLLHEKYPEWMRWIDERGKIIYVNRDVRAVLASFYSYARTFSKTADVPITEFIRQSFCGRRSRPVYWQEMQEHWGRKDGILQLDFDEVVKNTEETLNKTGQFLNLTPRMIKPLLPEKMTSLTKFRWQRMTAFRPESTAILGDAPAVSLKWQEVFSEDDLKFIEEEISKVKT
jgi:hypothetical protein